MDEIDLAPGEAVIVLYDDQLELPSRDHGTDALLLGIFQVQEVGWA